MKHLLSVCDMDNVVDLLDLADDYKEGRIREKVLGGKTLAMIFEKSSTRTRVSFEVGAFQMGAQPLYLSASDLQLGRGEPIADTARTLSRYVDGIMIRAISHSDVVELASEASVPVINGLTDLEHPCQALADMQTVREKLGGFDGRLVFVGDGNNVCHSLLLITATLGMDMDVACPPGYEPDPGIREMAEKIGDETGARTRVIHDPAEAVMGADVVYTDVWVSMGYEDEAEDRLEVFRPYQVNMELMELAAPGAIFMHCLPAVRGQETTAEVIDGPHSVVWDQAENRLHAQKAIMHWLMGDI